MAIQSLFRLPCVFSPSFWRLITYQRIDNSALGKLKSFANTGCKRVKIIHANSIIKCSLICLKISLWWGEISRYLHPKHDFCLEVKKGRLNLRQNSLIIALSKLAWFASKLAFFAAKSAKWNFETKFHLTSFKLN